MKNYGLLFKTSDNFSPEKEGKKLTNVSLGTYVYAKMAKC